ncbi:glutamate transport system substrate-binding protein [Nocardioides thalensis]|uniref:Glutamate transport system substrate-binding protein n=1 Tax=Nocardioides thalensis TaxID=1914755 RepID=A0A853BY65_9ACTN|nr:glutamate ABC transporter substrate-binding protein [Nocardioides thalensis]NYI99890.1 glutamate transport system substrate-binding protein [Nocardioides thalensis]
MRPMKFRAAAAVLLAASALAACGDAGSDDEGRDVSAEEDCDGKFEDGSAMADWSESGSIRIGHKTDQPGVGFQGATDDVPSGFDIEMAKILIADLCIDPDSDDVKWIETISDNREPFLQSDKVDLVLASYSITDERRAIVGQAGPYMITGQQVLVPSDSDVESIDDLKGEEVCSVTGSTSLENVNAAGAKGVGADDYSECAEKVLDGTYPAMSTDGTILAGLAAQNEGELKVVGEEFSEERIGVGYQKEEAEVCEWINGVLEESFEDGSWEDAFETTLGPSGVETPEAPELDPCQ